MFNKKDFLRFAFEEATTVVNVNSVGSAELEPVLMTRMKDYARREGLDFSEKELGETMKKGIAMLKHAEADFAF